jgi:hypothetical protein
LLRREIQIKNGSLFGNGSSVLRSAVVTLFLSEIFPVKR